MKKRRRGALSMLLRGLFFAIGITLLGMVLMAGAIVLLGMSDGLIRLCNQFLKVLAVGLGVFWAMGRGGEKGLVTGAAVGTVYALAGYCLCLVLGGGAFDLGQMLGEMLLCAAVGAATGVACSNLRAPRRA
ncbi:MAG: TIGR04086 family membrane protein [Eubacteriales bacterium]|nr:TIGR04086 family membrane protein [Eubacteriales bacterium]